MRWRDNDASKNRYEKKIKEEKKRKKGEKDETKQWSFKEDSAVVPSRYQKHGRSTGWITTTEIVGAPSRTSLRRNDVIWPWHVQWASTGIRNAQPPFDSRENAFPRKVHDTAHSFVTGNNVARSIGKSCNLFHRFELDRYQSRKIRVNIRVREVSLFAFFEAKLSDKIGEGRKWIERSSLSFQQLTIIQVW